MENQPRGAILQRDGATYAIVPRTPAGIISPEHLESIIKVVRRYNIPVIKMTSGQRMALVGIKKEDVEKIWNELGMTVGQATAPCVHYVQACPGTETCRYGKQDSLGLGLKIEEIYQDLNMPAKVKIGVSGCPRSCGESYLRDIGLLGTAKGWRVIFGGNAGGRMQQHALAGSAAEMLALHQFRDAPVADLVHGRGCERQLALLEYRQYQAGTAMGSRVGDGFQRKMHEVSGQ